MGVARLLAKGWVLVCLYAGAHVLTFVLQGNADLLGSLAALIACVILFLAMGLLFIAGYGAAAS